MEFIRTIIDYSHLVGFVLFILIGIPAIIIYIIYEIRKNKSD